MVKPKLPMSERVPFVEKMRVAIMVTLKRFPRRMVRMSLMVV